MRPGEVLFCSEQNINIFKESCEEKVTKRMFAFLKKICYDRKKDARAGGFVWKEHVMTQLNDKARRILDYITKEIGDGVPPSVREICAALQIKSTSTVHKYLK